MGVTFSVIISFFAIVLLSFLITSFLKIKSGTSPILAIAFTTLYFVLVGCLNILFIGGFCYFLLILAFFILNVYKNKDNIYSQSREFFSPAVVIFIVFSLFIIILLAVQSPMFTQWDEFSFWGTAAKVTKVENTLYSNIVSGLTNRSYPPSLIVLTYFFQFFSPEFSEWAMFASYDVLFMAVFACGISFYTNKEWKKAILSSGVFICVPFFFDVLSREATQIRTYMVAYADMPVAILFGGILAFYYVSEKVDSKTIFSLCTLLLMLNLIKDVSLAVGMIASVIILVDMLFIKRKDVSFCKLKGFFASVLAFLLMAFVQVIGYFGWSKYIGAVQGTSTLSTGGEANESIITVVIRGALEILGFNRSERLQAVLNNMINAFFSRPVCMIGSGFKVIILIVFILILAMIFAKTKSEKLRSLWYTVCGLGGFLGYYAFHTITYSFVLKGEEGLQLASYERYIYTYYVGFLIGALVLLFLAVRKNKVVLPVLTALTFLVCGYTLRSDMSILNIPQTVFNSRVLRSENKATTDGLRSDDDVIYLISQGDNAQNFYQYAYEFVPSRLVSMIEGGTFCPEVFDPEVYPYGVFVDRYIFTEYLRENECTHIFINDTNEYFIEEFSEMFKGDLEKYNYFKIVDNGEEMTFQPVLKEG